MWSREDMSSFYQPSLDAIIDTVQKQRQEVGVLLEVCGGSPLEVIDLQ